jgi:hypothetical protein
MEERTCSILVVLLGLESLRLIITVICDIEP